MGMLCISGGVAGFVRTRSIPSLVAGTGYAPLSSLPQIHAKQCSSVGLLYLWSADSIRKGTPNGLEGAVGEVVCPRTSADSNPFIGASALLLLSSLPRVTKGPIPVVLAATSTATGMYYGRIWSKV
jgi:uncharacterized membrane protein (UPF0136 family)